MALPFLSDLGWKATVVCVDSEGVAAPLDPVLGSTIPSEIAVHRVQAYSMRWTKLVGVGSLAARSYRRISTCVDRLLASQEFDLIYFSTTEFGLFPLGPRWLKAFGVPYVIDLQDPWVNPYYRDNQVRPPGGYAKHRIHQWFATKQEPNVLRNASGIMVVSERYSRTLCDRYAFLDPGKFLTIPFAASLKDIDVATSSFVKNSCFDKSDGRTHWVYVGRCGPDMSYSLRSILASFKKYVRSQPDEAHQVLMHFIGTDYAAKDSCRFWVKPIAEELGIAQFIQEAPARIPYFEALRCLADADAVIVPGSSDSSYTASKIYPYIAARRPMLTVFHEESSVNNVVRRVGAGVNVTFSSDDHLTQTTDEIYARWFEGRGFEQASEINEDEFAKHLAPAMTDRMVQCFDAALCPRETHSHS